MPNKRNFKPKKLRLVIRLPKPVMAKLEVTARDKQTSVNELVAAITIAHVGTTEPEQKKQASA